MKTYKDLPQKKGLELVLWLSRLNESLENSKIQMNRWNRNKKGWDLELFFISIVFIDDATRLLKPLLTFSKDYIKEKELVAILKEFRKIVKKYNINNLRNDLIHREKIFKLQNRKGKRFFDISVLVLGGYNFTTDVYTFGPLYNIKVHEVFEVVKKLEKDLKELYAKKLNDSYASKNNKYESMIPYSLLRSFEK